MADTSIRTLCEELGFGAGHGYRETALPEVTLFRAAGHESACPLLYETGLAFILQGYKVGFAGGVDFRNGGDRYLILSNHLAVRCETLATSEEPVLGLHVGIDRLELQRLVHALHDDPAWRERQPLLERSVVSAQLTAEIRRALDALIETLHDPYASRALGPARLTQLYYAVLRSEDGRVLELLARTDSKLARISATMRHMEQRLDEKISMEDLAAIANMSRSAFQRAFKDVTGESPLQYLKQLRLSTARNLIAFKGEPAYLAAHHVGYESASQFSREFKRYYGVPPSRVSELPYSKLQGLG
ncbi:MAG: AraC family transcriptional regulator [Myxococcota bacterium]|nr:AraC family transcriptional regulator [Myxococcota bacterium]